MKLTKVESGTVLLNPEVEQKIVEFERLAKQIKEQEDALKESIKEEMERIGLIKVESESLTISYIAPTDRESFDTKAFRQAHSGLYDEYIKMTQVKSSVRIKVK